MELRQDKVKNLVKKLKQSGPVPSGGQLAEDNTAELATRMDALQENFLGAEPSEESLTQPERPAKRKVRLLRSQPAVPEPSSIQ